MKSETMITAQKVKTAASIVNALGILAGAVLIILGILVIAAGSSSYLYVSLASVGGIRLILSGIVTLIINYVIYVLITGFSVIVANSDKTDIINALNELNDELKNS
ncbi:MAG: hypothetical protein K5796_06455 [Lachnospiraceae bacterium]|nr:hypothetical protein [Lachnospiraceae bacterium]